MKMVADSMVRVVSMPTGYLPTQTATQPELRGGHQTVYDPGVGRMKVPQEQQQWCSQPVGV